MKYTHKKQRNIYMGWLQLAVSLKLQVSFAKNYFLQKRPVILRSQLIVATSYQACQRTHF